jgi:hypothetical protein
VGADTIGVLFEVNAAASRVRAALPDWNVVVMPAVNYGQGGANVVAGMAFETWWTEGFADLMLRAVRGENLGAGPRIPDGLPPAMAPLLEKALEDERAFQDQLDAWLGQRRKP